jgi:hypothetical protein
VPIRRNSGYEPGIGCPVRLETVTKIEKRAVALERLGGTRSESGRIPGTPQRDVPRSHTGGQRAGVTTFDRLSSRHASSAATGRDEPQR